MVSPITVTPLGASAWRLSWTSDLTSPTFWVYRDGILIQKTSLNSVIVSVAPGTSPVFEVLDSAAAPSTAPLPAFASLAWFAAAGSVSYRVEQQQPSGGSWSTAATLADTGLPYYLWRSGTLPDGQTTSFRVTPVGANGNDGTPITFAVLIVRYPDPPAVTYAFDAVSGTVTISA